MKKTLFVFSALFALSTLLITSPVSAETSGLGSVGIDKISLSQDVASVIKITPTFFNLGDKDQTAILEVSVTDNYSEEQVMNIDKLTSDIIDTELVIPKTTTTYAKSYTYALPEIAKKNTYRIELRVLDRNRNLLYLRQSDVLTLGTDTAIKAGTLTLQSRFEYDGATYGLQDGPIVKAEKKDSAFYVFEINNLGTEAVTIRTDYSSRKYASKDSLFVKNESAQNVTEVSKKTKQTIKIPAKYFNDFGTFEGKVDIYAEKAGRSTLLRTEEFRYMIGDAFIVVTDVTVGTTTAALSISKTLFDSAVELTDEVLNSTSSAEVIRAQDSKEYTFTLTFKDAAGMDVVSSQSKILWADIMPVLKVPATFSNKERSQITQVDIMVVDATNQQLFKNTFPVSLEVVDAMSMKEIGVIVGLVLMIISLIGYVATRRKGWLVFIILFLASVLFVRYSNVFATEAINSGNFTMSAFTNGQNYPSNSGCWAHGYRGLTMSPVTYPSPSQQFSCGSTVTLRLDPVNSTCANTPADTYFIINSTNGLDVIGDVYTSVFQKNYVTVYNRPVGRSGVATPIRANINPGFSGAATLKGYYYQANGQCSSRTGEVTFTFNSVQCTSSCTCSGRNNVCSSGGVTSTTTNAAECQLTASCGVSINGDQATFNTTVTHGLGALSYTNTGTGTVVSNPVTRTIPAGGSVTQRTTVRDAFDGLTAGSSCTASIEAANNTAGCTDDSCEAVNTPVVSEFLADPSIVNAGQSCVFKWKTENMALCSFKVNGVDRTPGEDNGRVGNDVRIATDDTNNKLGVLTCTSSSTRPVIITASTTCRVNPEVRQF